jgi:acyl-CoA reductase-like NAD-dependent aldehyde dehydrogenase
MLTSIEQRDYTIPTSYDLFINNSWHRSSSNDVVEVRSPLTGKTLCTVPDAGERDVVEAVMAAKAAWPLWSRLGARKRAEAIFDLADRLMEQIDRFAWLETANTGKPWRESYANVATAADRLRYFASVSRALDGSSLPAGNNILSYDIREPLGVVGIIGAWNFPLNMFLGKIAPAIATGNAVVYKPAEPTPITTLEIARLMIDILPPGVVNVLTGRGHTTGEAIVSYPDIRKISLTGSIPTGRKAMAAAAASTKQMTLELGGKNAQIVFDDADLDRAAQGILLGAFMNQGQVCTSGSRVFAHHAIADKLQERILAMVPKLRIGDPFDKSTEIGTLVYLEHLEKVQRYIEIGRAEGAKLLKGGKPAKVAGFPNGLFFEPTVFTDVQTDMVIACEEIFGPVMTLQRWGEEFELLSMVNGLDFGLAAGVWTENLGRAHRMAQAVEAGRVWVNCYNLFPSGAAFGGTKASGYGREDAFETMLAFTQVKNVIADISESPRKFFH